VVNRLGSPVSARIAAAPTADRPVIEVASSVSPSSPRDGDHPLLGPGQAGPGLTPVGQQQRDPVQRTAAHRGLPGRTGARSEHRVDDLLPRPDRLPASDLTARRHIEPSPTQADDLGQVAVSGTAERDGQGRVQDAGLNGCRAAPGTAGHAHSGLGQAAAQLGGQPRDQHRILVIGLIEGQVLGLAAGTSAARLRR
jgi:hypothetical protein